MSHEETDTLDPRTALQMYLQQRRSEVADATLSAHERRLRKFVEWCRENDIDDVGNLSGYHLHEFSVWWQKGAKTDDLSPEPLRSALLPLRVFLRFLRSIDAVGEELPDKVILPKESSRGPTARHLRI